MSEPADGHTRLAWYEGGGLEQLADPVTPAGVVPAPDRRRRGGEDPRAPALEAVLGGAEILVELKRKGCARRHRSRRCTGAWSAPAFAGAAIVVAGPLGALAATPRWHGDHHDEGGVGTSQPWVAEAHRQQGGFYRALTVAVQGQSAGTDAANRWFRCLAEGGKGTGSVIVSETEIDAEANRSSTTVMFAGHPAVTVPTDSTGAGAATTDPYPWRAGSNHNVIFQGSVGTGPPRGAHSYYIEIAIVC